MSTPLVWAVSLGLAGALLVVDVAVVGPSTARAVHRRVRAVPGRFYIGLAVASASASGGPAAPTTPAQFYAGWLTEYSLSVDNLFVFLLIMSKFAVPRQYQQTALLVGIILALVLPRPVHLGGRGGHRARSAGCSTCSARSSSTRP